MAPNWPVANALPQVLKASARATQGHCTAVTVISPAVPVVGKLPVTFKLPPPTFDTLFDLYDKAR
jgi:hypothetical protein